MDLLWSCLDYVTRLNGCAVGMTEHFLVALTAKGLRLATSRQPNGQHEAEWICPLPSALRGSSCNGHSPVSGPVTSHRYGSIAGRPSAFHSGDRFMSHADQIADHHEKAAAHHEKAAHHHRKAAEYHKSDDVDTAAQHAHSAHGHDLHAEHHAEAAS